MDLWLWSLLFLPVAVALRNLPEVKLEGILGSSVTIECPLRQTYVRLYLCREVPEFGVCSTVVSSKNFVKEEYKNRVTLTPYPDENVFLVEVTELTKSDGGVYACGTGTNTDRGKTQLVTLSVHSEYDLFWEDELMPESPRWLNKLLHRQVPPWLQMAAHASSLEFIPKATTPAQRTEAPPATHPSSTTRISHRPRVSRASSVAATKPPTFLPSTTTSKTSTPVGLRRLQTAGYNYHTRLHRQRAFHKGPVSGMEDQGFHILVPTALSLILLTLVGLLVKRAIQRSKGERLGARLGRATPSPHLPVPLGELEAPLPGPAPSAPSAPPQVSEALSLHSPSLKTSCEYVSLYYQPVIKAENSDSDDYVNIPHVSSCPPGPSPWCQ
ncbi:fas apoptotic inhibitory molecule 3 [Suricata suricatta]|uniref:fas apoptotic inhibitory molecule 3 n=1 Tax=Suricata suricatta TaxID=37032 RepID=UPI001156072A|nr:fas apoptotic inhibitory molecule 3 [Suricata suricatta]